MKYAAIAVGHMERNLLLHKKSSYKLIRNAISAEACVQVATSVVPGADNRGPKVRGEAVATDDGVNVSQHLEVLAGACMPKPEIPSGHTRSGRQPGALL